MIGAHSKNDSMHKHTTLTVCGRTVGCFET